MATVKKYTPTPAVEFKNGKTRPSMGSAFGGAGSGGLLGRLNTNSTLYRQSAPALGNLAGSPGIPETDLKKYNRPGVSFFGQDSKLGGYGRGAGNGTNEFTDQARSALPANASLKGGTGKPNNRGFMCGKTMSYGIDNSDYGSGDPASAADASFYRLNMDTSRYGETIAFTDSRGNRNSSGQRNGQKGDFRANSGQNVYKK